VVGEAIETVLAEEQRWLALDPEEEPWSGS
jgi:hypothetical protein